MTRDRFFRRIGVLYALFLSGILFYGVPTDGDTFLARLFGMTLCFVALYLPLRFYPEEKAVPSPLFPPSCFSYLSSLAALLLCLWSEGSLFYELSREMPQISDILSGGRFSHFFWILSLLLVLYITKGSDSVLSLSRLVLLLLPALLFLPIFTWFSFLDYDGALPSFMPELEHAFSFRFSYFTDSVSFFGVLFFYLAAQKEREIRDGTETAPKEKSGKKALSIAFLLFLFTFFAECIKNLLYFGAAGSAVLPRPDRTLLSVVPYLNVQEVFLFAYYFSFILRLCVFACAARHYVGIFTAKTSEKTRALLCPLLVGALFYGAFLLTAAFPILCEKAYLSPLLFLFGQFLVSSLKSGTKQKSSA